MIMRLLALRSQGVNAGHDLECGAELHGQCHHQVLRSDQQQSLSIHLLHEEVVGVAGASGNVTDEIAHLRDLGKKKTLNGNRYRVAFRKETMSVYLQKLLLL